MAHRVISLKYRPQSFDGLTGQCHIALSLKGAIKSGAIGHAFLFAGPRGVGKTTTARIFAKSVNCAQGPTVQPCQECQQCREITTSRSVDVIEIDGASNRGIDEIRNLRESIKYAPLYCRYKIYIIDEVHMLTPEAFNALLKTLEEPPTNVIFILATTNPSKVPATILSRCQRFIFKRLSIGEISQRLREVAEKEQIKISERALYCIAVRADGSVRDGESILEQLSSFVEEEITEEDVYKLVGLLGSDFYIDLLTKIAEKDLRSMMINLNQGIENGADPLEIYRGLVGYLRKIFLLHTGLDHNVIESNAEEAAVLKSIKIPGDKVIEMLETCLRMEENIRRSVNPRIAIELLFGLLVSAPPGIPEKKHNPNTRNTGPQKLMNIKDRFIAGVEKKSPRLAAIIHQTEVSEEGNTFVISVKNEFQKKELANNQKQLKEIVTELFGEGRTVEVRVHEGQQKKSDSLAETIKNMFDGEEVR